MLDRLRLELLVSIKPTMPEGERQADGCREGSARARAVRAEMTTIGGRTRSVLELELLGGPAFAGVEARSAIQTAFREVLLSHGPCSADRFKRQRMSSLFATATL